MTPPPTPAPLFTVILCTFNRADLLPRALESLLAQRRADWDAIIVDDGSTDHTAEVVRPYVQRDARLRYVHHANQGLARSRNRAARLARGDFITFLDSDDAFTPDHLAQRRAAVQQHPAIDFFYGGVQVIGDPYVADKNHPDQLIHLDQCIVDATFVIRRRTFLALGGFPVVAYAAGNALYHRARAQGIAIVKLDAPTYIYDRTTPDSICTLVAQGGVDAIDAYRRDGSRPR